MKKPAIIAIAVLLLGFYLFGFFRWLNSGHTVQGVLSTLTSDWFLLITFVDLAVFFLLCMSWLVTDMRQRGMGVGKISALILGCLLIGVAPLLVYIALRNNRPTPALPA